MKKIIIILLLTFIQQSYSQWQEFYINSHDVDVTSLAVCDTNIIAGTSDGLFISSDSCKSWVLKNIDLPNPYVLSLTKKENRIFAGTYGKGITLSTDNGDTWTRKNFNLRNLYVTSITISGNNIFTGTYGGGIYLSTDNGESWTDKNIGLTNLNIWALSTIDNNIFACAYGCGVFLSTDNGESWVLKNSGITNTNVQSSEIYGNNIWVGTHGGGLYLSTDFGENWTSKNTGITNLSVISFSIFENNIFISTNMGIFLSTDNGENWNSRNQGLKSTMIYSLTNDGYYIYAGATGAVYKCKLSDLGITDIKENKYSDNRFSIYPNPANSSIYINSNENIIGKEINIISLSGKKVWNGKAENNEFQINIEFLTPGLYFLQIGYETRMFLKQ